MVANTLSALTLGLAALSSALPSSKKKKKRPQSVTQSDDFEIGLIAEGYPLLTLNAIQSGTLGNLDLVFERPFSLPWYPCLLQRNLS
jgi:hypothetical protein